MERWAVSWDSGATSLPALFPGQIADLLHFDLFRSLVLIPQTLRQYEDEGRGVCVGKGKGREKGWQAESSCNKLALSLSCFPFFCLPICCVQVSIVDQVNLASEVYKMRTRQLLPQLNRVALIT